MEPFKSSLFFLMPHGLIKSCHFSSNSTSIMSGSDFEEVLRLPPPGNPSREKKSPFGCHTMFPQLAQRTIWFLYPTNCLLQAGQAPLMMRLLATVPMRRGPAKGRIQVANIRHRKSHPDNANQRKKIVAKPLPSGVSIKSLISLLYLGQFLLKSRVKVRHRCPISNSRSISRALSDAD